ncbi:MAG TPA: POTRA domain-containing protein [Vicinamibacterales bacterium]|jgi:outer membrane protein assembly factor BamA
MLHLSLFLVLLSYSFDTGHVQATMSLVIGELDAAGMRRYTKAEIVRISGLRVGQTVTLDDVNKAMARMARTGLFTQLNYRYTTAKGRATITFDVRESEWTMPVTFDNFVWFADAALTAALRETVPSFDSTAPLTDGFVEYLTGELSTLLAAKKIPGTVAFMPQGDMRSGGKIQGYLFKVQNPAPRMCSMKINGASAIAENELTAALAAAVGAEYSRATVAATARGTLTDLYRQRGHWRAAFGAPQAALESGSSCDGAALTLAVEEGPAYAWDRAEWFGNAALAARDLDRLLALRAGDLANVRKLDDGLREIQKAYRKQGYMRQAANYVPRLSDETKRAIFEIRVDEGPQYRLGTVSFPGLGPKEAEMLGQLWKLKAGEVFDGSYPNEFFAQQIRPRLRPGAAPPRMQLQMDEANRLVNVSVVFGGPER